MGSIELSENSDNFVERTQLIQMLRQPRDGKDLILSEEQVQTLKASYAQCHEKPAKIQQFYHLVKDFTDVKSMELVMDHTWEFGKNLVR